MEAAEGRPLPYPKLHCMEISHSSAWHHVKLVQVYALTGTTLTSSSNLTARTNLCSLGKVRTPHAH